MNNLEIYGYAVEIFNKFKDDGGYWDRYNRKIYKSEDVAKRAIEENPYYKLKWDGFMDGYKIIPLYHEV